MITEQSTLEEICFEVCTALQRQDIEAVLCGGSAAAFYAPQEYMSYDADFVLGYEDSLENVALALHDLGFVRGGRSRIFSHPQSRFTVDFPKGPLGIGGEYVHSVETIEKNGLRLRVVTRADCVRDRLAHFYHWNDYTALNAAVAVAASGIDLTDLHAIRAWSEREDPALLVKFGEFERRLNAALGHSR